MERHKWSKAENIDDRIRELLDVEFGGRGRFGKLEELSGIPLNRWKNFVYKRQKASPEMIDFICKKCPEETVWIRTGKPHPDQKAFPFLAAVPVKWKDQTVGDRLTWAIKEWASPKGEQLFQYLEEKSNDEIEANAWAQVILGAQEPTIKMIELVATYRPHFLEWIIRGRVSGALQVDPTDKKSIDKWVQHDKQELDEFFAALAATAKK